MILIHIPEETERLRYIFDFIFSDIIRIPYRLTTSEEEFLQSGLPRFSYGRSRIGNNFYIFSSSLLFETQVERKDPVCRHWKDLTVFFCTEEGDLPFDLFAAAFYLVSRYEEYLPYSGDRHGRFQAEESIAFRASFLERPVVNLWAGELKNALRERFPGLQFPAPVFSFTPTIDIDNAYAYKYKGAGRVVMSLLHKLVRFEFSKFWNRILVHLGYRQDPYDSYAKQWEIHARYKVKPLYFILLGDYGKYDKNLSHRNPNYIRLIRALNEKASVGIHPSYNSGNSEKQLSEEKSRLEKITGQAISRSRQHYIMLSVPETYRRLIRLGIREDYSMGYPSRTGFRAGTCTPFFFFDLEENKKTELKVFPFVAMDSTLKYYSRFRSKEVIPYLRPIVSEIKKVGGEFIFIFHNESIGNRRNWKNWGDLYEKLIKLSRAES